MPRIHDSTGTGGVATPSRRDDRSGLLDIRALSSVIDAQRRAQPSASASSVALPSFAPWALHDLQPAAIPEPVVPRRAAPAGTDDRLLYAMITALSLAVLSLGAYVVLRPPPTRVVETVAVGVPAVAAFERDTKPEPEPEPEPAAAEESEGAESEAESEAEAEEAEEAEAADDHDSRTRTRTRMRTRTRASKPDASKPASSKPKPKPEPQTKGPIPVECIIDPSQCSASGKPKPRTGPSEPAKPTGALPESPSASQIRSALASVKPEARACRARHGGASGEQVRVKLSAVGTTGRIDSAKALEDHAGTALGNCVARALAAATLPRFSKPRTGIVYSVRL